MKILSPSLLALAALTFGIAGCGKEEKKVIVVNVADAAPSASASSSSPYKTSIHPPPPLAPAPATGPNLPRVLSFEGDIGDTGLVAGQPVPNGWPLRIADPAAKVALRDSRSGLEFKLAGPFRVYLAPAKVAIIEGQFESQVVPSGALEFWISTPWGTMRTTGRVRIKIEPRTHSFETLDGEAFLYRLVSNAGWEKIEHVSVDHAEMVTEERAAQLCTELDAAATKLAAEVAGAGHLDTKKAQIQMEAKKVAQGACETARTRLLESMKKQGPMLYAQIEKKSVL